MYLDIYLFYVYVSVGLPAVLASVAVDASDQAHLVLEAGAVVDLLLDAATEEALQTSHNALVDRHQGQNLPNIIRFIVRLSQVYRIRSTYDSDFKSAKISIWNMVT